MPTLDTERLILRRWLPTDRAPFAALNADPAVTEFLLGPMTRKASDALIDWIEARFDSQGFGLWAVERKDTGDLIGFTGLNRPAWEAHFTPCVEIGWRLARDHWGRGFATEAARRALEYGFHTAGLDEIVSFTVPMNVRSRNVMEKLGMRHDADGDFDHPMVADGHPMKRHVLYRLVRP